MADSDKIITVTPNTSVATTHPEIKLVGKDNSPMYLKVLDDNTLSFEGTEGQVFSIGPTMSSGDIFSVNDISGVQNMVVNADGTIKIIPTGTNPSSNLYVGDLRHCFVYARGTGNNNAANSLVYLNGKKIVDSATRGLMLTIINQTDLSVVSSTNYDTYSGGSTNTDNLATAIGNMTDQQIGILISEDAWEPNSANGANLWAAARLVGLTKLGHYDGGDGSVRRPYAAIFMGSGDDANAANKFVIERMSDADADAPMASVSAMIVSDGTHASISGAQYQNALWSSDSNHEEPALIVDEDKHVGINTVTPVRPLHVTGDAYVQNGGILLSRGNYYLQDASDGDKRGSFSSAGVWAWENVDVGIGTTSPSTKLDVSGTVNATNLTIGGAQGSDGQVLTSTGSGVGWEDASGGGGGMTSFQLEDGDSTEVTISDGKEVKFKEGTGIEINWTDTSTGSDGDPYDLQFTVDVSDFMSNGSNNRVVTATGTDAMNAEANLHFDGTGLGIGTSAIPHGSKGTAKLAIEGTNQNVAGPHIQTTTASDDYPLLQILSWQHDNISIGFDAWYTPTDGWTSSDAGSNYQIYKHSDTLKFRYDSGVSADADITWNDGFQLTTDGIFLAHGGMQGKKTVMKNVSSNTTLADGDSGKTIYWTGGTLTLPATAEAGQQFVIINNTGGSATPGLGTSNAIVSGWTSHAAMADETARTYISPAANKWLYIG